MRGGTASSQFVVPIAQYNHSHDYSNVMNVTVEFHMNFDDIQHETTVLIL